MILYYLLSVTESYLNTGGIIAIPYLFLWYYTNVTIAMITVLLQEIIKWIALPNVFSLWHTHFKVAFKANIMNSL